MKVFFSDLDGTLLNSDKTISPAMREAVSAYVASGNSFVISTGRPLSSAIAVRDLCGLNFPGSYLSAYNGAILYDNTEERVIHKACVPADLVPEIVALADKYGLHIQSYRDKYAVARTYSDNVEYYMRKTGMSYIITPDFFGEIEPSPPKLIVIDIHSQEKLLPFRDEVREKYASDISAFLSEPRFCEIVSVHAGKGKSLLKLCEILHVPREDSLAAGDDENDLSMIREAGTGIAMINALESVRKEADVVTEKDNDHDGLLPFFLENT